MSDAEPCVGVLIWRVLLRTAERVAETTREEMYSVAWGYLDAGDERSARRLLRRYRRRGQRAAILAHLAEHHARHGRREDALGLLPRALEMAVGEKAPRPRADALRAIAAASVACERYDLMYRALSLVGDEPSASWRASVCPRLVEAGRYDEALALAREIAEPRTRAGALGEIADSLMGRDEFRRALELLEEALALDPRAARYRSPGALSLSTVQYGPRAKAYVGLGEYAPALALIEAIVTRGHNDLTLDGRAALAQILAGLVQQGDGQPALAVVHRVRKPYQRGEVLVEAARCLLRRGDLRGAERMWAELLRVAPVEYWAGQGNQVLAALAEAYGEAGHRDRALELLHLIEPTNEQPDRWAEAFAAVRIARCYLEAGQPTLAASVAGEAVSAASEIVHPETQARVLGQAARVLDDAGQANAAMAALGAGVAEVRALRAGELDWRQIYALVEMARAFASSDARAEEGLCAGLAAVEQDHPGRSAR